MCTLNISVFFANNFAHTACVASFWKIRFLIFPLKSFIILPILIYYSSLCWEFFFPLKYFFLLNAFVYAISLRILDVFHGDVVLNVTIHLTNGNGENSNVDGSSLSPTIKLGKKKRIIELQGEPVHQHCETLRNFFQSHEIVGSLNSLKNFFFFLLAESICVEQWFHSLVKIWEKLIVYGNIANQIHGFTINYE